MRAPAPIPAAKSWLTDMPSDFGMMLNDQLGDCTCAAMFHARQVWSFNAAGSEATESDADVLDAYEEACGYNPSDPTTDQGGNEQSVLTWWTQTGIKTAAAGRDKLLAFIEIDPRHTDDVRRAIYECGLVYIGFNVPGWLMASGQIPAVWNADPDADNSIVGGHAIVLPGYDFANLAAAQGTFDLISWGANYRMTTSFFSQFVDEVYALADHAWVTQTGQTPLGLTVAELEAQMAALP